MTLALVLGSLTVASAVASPPARVVGRVNGVAIMSDRLEAAFNALVPLESFHRGVSPEKMAALRERALQNLVDEELQYQDGVRRALAVTDAEVGAALARVKKTYPSPQALADRLRRAGQTLADVRREIRRSLTIAKAHNLAVGSRCQVSRDEAANFFQANPARFVIPEQLHVYAITIGVDPSSSDRQWADAKSRAEDVLRQLSAGAAFAEMARKYSTDASRTTGGDMGFVHRGSLSDELEAATRDLKPGQDSDVVQTLYGYHIVRVSEIRPPHKTTFAELGAEIQKDLTAKRCAEVHDAWLAQLRAEATIVLGGTKPGGAAQAPRPRAQTR